MAKSNHMVLVLAIPPSLLIFPAHFSTHPFTLSISLPAVLLGSSSLCSTSVRHPPVSPSALSGSKRIPKRPAQSSALGARTFVLLLLLMLLKASFLLLRRRFLKPNGIPLPYLVHRLFALRLSSVALFCPPIPKPEPAAYSAWSNGCGAQQQSPTGHLVQLQCPRTQLYIQCTSIRQSL